MTAMAKFACDASSKTNNLGKINLEKSAQPGFRNQFFIREPPLILAGLLSTMEKQDNVQIVPAREQQEN
jgi:hypothetical protein